ncbi:HNH endonuclease [Xanthobacter autotrophicus]|uniref:HNH endonuclease n=1 Tax=Xanthobacter autotrophicus TaxID=280 RepID=UPI00372D5B79
MPIERRCPACGSMFRTYPSRLARGEGTYCSRACSNPARGRSGADNGNWRGGRFVRSDGYVAVRVDGQYRLEHDIVMERLLGRRLRRGEQVHHRNNQRADNRPENLELVDWSSHISEYHAMQRDLEKWVVVACNHCGSAFERRRHEHARHPDCYCSRKCYLESRRPASRS